MTFQDPCNAHNLRDIRKSGNLNSWNAETLNFFSYRCTATGTSASGTSQDNSIIASILYASGNLSAYTRCVGYSGRVPCGGIEIII